MQNDPNATDGFAVTLLDETYTAPATPRKSAKFEAPLPAEGTKPSTISFLLIILTRFPSLAYPNATVTLLYRVVYAALLDISR